MQLSSQQNPLITLAAALIALFQPFLSSCTVFSLCLADMPFSVFVYILFLTLLLLQMWQDLKCPTSATLAQKCAQCSFCLCSWLCVCVHLFYLAAKWVWSSADLHHKPWLPNPLIFILLERILFTFSVLKITHKVTWCSRILPSDRLEVD